MTDTPAAPLRAFEDFTAGESGTLGTVDVTHDEVVEFASQFDPQPFHLEEEAGKASPLGGHAASGWHTGSMMMRLMAENLLNISRSMGSGGIQDLKWLKPVLVGDTLTAGYEITGVRPSASRTDRGYVDMKLQMVNQRGERVMSFLCTVIMGRAG
ncbi:bifunctional enoyl-CoA hydratase/phosphate acetyltransferase [Hartmannibacter diazotrophicus]|uniref:Bifunctional enoyl-CoA hydratase/phosphate acetyltransferase n=1 Tax=Hartmannibacter diazotrophicus TaxID=1482074 RepID=A0A2C9D892_9HYPH|nr:MaoC family dehydratase [Hartmannibacter diazotrophicus]SON56527.1 bifunctional enoyl-CoA hydratase/phosphate acetyltransferase [Hartmannibacter diazotrophicus]